MIRRIVYLTSYWLNLVGECAVVVLMLLVLASVILRKVYIATPGLFEGVCLTGLILYVSIWSYTQVHKRHIRVHFLVSRFPLRVQAVIDSITYVLSLGVCSLVTWWSIQYALLLKVGGNIISPFLEVPLFFIAYLIGFAFMFLGVVILIDLVDSIGIWRHK